jgi:hypothetical protein
LEWRGNSSGIGGFLLMGRMIPSFRIALAMEKEEWKKPFRNALDKSDRKRSLTKITALPD